MIVFAGIGAFIVALMFPKKTQEIVSSVSAAASRVFGPPAPPPVRWNAQLVRATAATYRSRYGLNVDPVMIAAMAQIESSFNPSATRYEPHLNDSSYGLMQVMLKTGQWLYDDLGYKAFPRPTASNMKDGYTSIYYGMAYAAYLSRYRGVNRPERFIVESYNGGPGNSNAQTQNHYAKYQQAKAEIIGTA